MTTYSSVMKTIFLCFVLLPVSFCGVVQRHQKAGCGYVACPDTDPNKLNVHLVPHTHDDVGWLKTVDQYYYGSRSDVQRVGVQYILDEVVQSLLWNPERRFSYAETAFFWMWWEELDDSQKEQVKGLVDAGRLEFIGGGWSQSDEANPNYQMTIDQMTLGLRKLNDTFGECGRPRVAWQIDPFGHSREVASQFAQMGFDGLFFARIDYQDRDKRRRDKTLEQVWQTSRSLGEESWLFTGAFYTHYSPPSGFCFDLLCGGDAPIIDNDGPDNNVESRVADFVAISKEVSQGFTTNNIMFTMGDDFNYQSGSFWFRNMDRIIKHVNELSDEINVFYSTPSCYLQAVNSAGSNWTTKQDDFFPYGDRAGDYLTGYFTSRPTQKHFIYKANHFLQVTNQLHALAKLGPQEMESISRMKEAIGVNLHHDAITGTEKQDVTNDYVRLITDGFHSSQPVAEQALNKLFGATDLPLQSCLLLNISQCDVTENNAQFVVTVYNPLARSVSHYFRIPVADGGYEVISPSGAIQPSELIDIPDFIQNIPGRTSSATQELVFRAEDLPPVGYSSYYVRQTTKRRVSTERRAIEREAISFGNEAITVTLEDETNLLQSISRLGVEYPARQNFYYYIGSKEDPISSCYVFTPESDEPIEISPTASGTIYQGSLVQEAVLEYNEWTKQIIRVYDGEDHVEMDWIVGPIPTSDGISKEVITRFDTDIATNAVFYTDTNGREIERRQRDYRPTWDLEVTQAVSGNYYPVTSRIVINEEGGAELAVLNDRPQGGTSMKDGQVELMLHRRLEAKDFFGEALNETQFGQGLVARGTHYLLVGPSGNGSTPSLSAQEKLLAQSKTLAPWTFFTPTQLSFEDWSQLYPTQFSGLTAALPDNIHLLTLEPWNENVLLVRLEHQIERDQDSELSKRVTVDLANLFSNFNITSATETMLATNQIFTEKNRLQWRVAERLQEEEIPRHRERLQESMEISLDPMQIRTFILGIE